MYSGIGFVLLHHFWEKGRNECSGETRFASMDFLPRIAAAVRLPPLAKASVPFTALSLRSLHQFTRCFSVKEAAVGWLAMGRPLQDDRLPSCGSILQSASIPQAVLYIYHSSCYLVCMDQTLVQC
ncbi:hypothetical protein BS78_03G255800 [Paspalum vaginatum]|nr:hypothetical protein BS78_03G255800 [Paspalum vaginatum]